MKKVKLKILTGFENKFWVDVESLEGVMPLWCEILKIIKDKIEPEWAELNDKFMLGHLQYLKPGETFESVLNALWDFQKSLLPENFIVDALYLQKYCIYRMKNIKKDYPFKHIACEPVLIQKFYDPATQVITITSWED